ncbi:hypothetical protein H9L15_10785 [Sphingomonas daechungensis]|uniref:Uncharacterized protein n=1 Tax=Sphingomonas daechungensis TaxID=1176646 RepID=A0ABX6SZB9_9SPHN|nr:hypothetical protein [Sphingomonas daechungensis]QNP42646.1 hypothetical protein H9L15_10785 [Sphingomonas daechungensis]
MLDPGQDLADRRDWRHLRLRDSRCGIWLRPWYRLLFDVMFVNGFRHGLVRGNRQRLGLEVDRGSHGRRRRRRRLCCAPSRKRRIKRSDELPAVGASRRQHILPLKWLQSGGRKNRCGHGHSVAREENDQCNGKLRPGYGTRGGGTERLLNARRIGQDDLKRPLGERGRKVGRARQKLDQLAPADGAVVRIGRGLRQHRIQAIIEPH